MAHSPNAKPRGFWNLEATTLRRTAPGMTLEQLIARYNTTRVRMLQTLNKLQIDFADKHKGTLTKEQITALAKLAVTHTPRQMSEHFGVSIECIHGYLARNKIKAQSGIASALWNSRRAELEQIAPSMTLKQLQAHYQIQGHEHTIGAIRQALKLLGVEWTRTKVQSELYSRTAELSELAKCMTRHQMADLLGYSPKYLWKVLDQMGITAVHGKSGPRGKPQPTHAQRSPKLSKPADRMDAAIPSRASIASSKPAQIIWPDHVKVQHIGLRTLPQKAPICAGTMHAPYVPSKDWSAAPRNC